MYKRIFVKEFMKIHFLYMILSMLSLLKMAWKSVAYWGYQTHHNDIYFTFFYFKKLKSSKLTKMVFQKNKNMNLQKQFFLLTG